MVLGRGDVILPEAGLYKPTWEHDAKTPAGDLTGHLARRAGTEYASVAGPVLAFTGRLREQRAEQIVVLIPVATPDRLRYRFLHDHLDLMLAAALRSRADIVTARVPVLLHLPDHRHGASKALP